MVIPTPTSSLLVHKWRTCPIEQVYAAFLKDSDVDFEESRSRLLALFQAIDLNRNGSLSRAELTEFVRRMLAFLSKLALLAVDIAGYVYMCMCMCTCVRMRSYAGGGWRQKEGLLCRVYKKAGQGKPCRHVSRRSSSKGMQGGFIQAFAGGRATAVGCLQPLSYTTGKATTPFRVVTSTVRTKLSNVLVTPHVSRRTDLGLASCSSSLLLASSLNCLAPRLSLASKVSPLITSDL